MVGLALLLAAGCGEGPPGDSRLQSALLPQNRNVDLLFMVDDSSSMRLLQDALIAGFPTLMDTLSALPGGLPNIHVAVISQDMGAGDGSVASCDAAGGKNGIFQYTPRGSCTATTLQQGATYISKVNGVANYTAPDVADVFTCIAALGEAGCGFEHQFAAVLRALGADGASAPAENQGFLRADALLAIVMVTNEDDCSATPGVPLYDTGSNVSITSAIGPPANYRCNEFGHVCGGAHPIRMAPNNDVTATFNYSDCTSNDTEGYLLSAADTANRIKAIKNDPQRLLVTVITGPKTPYKVEWAAPFTTDTSCGAASCPWPRIAHSCTTAAGGFADPAVRLSDWVQAFGSDGFLMSICDDFGPTMRKVGEEIGQRIGLSVDGGIDDGGASGGAGGGSAGGAGGGATGGRGGAAGGGGAAGAVGGAGGTVGAGGATGAAGAGGRGGTAGSGTAGAAGGAAGSAAGRGGAGGATTGGGGAVGGAAAGTAGAGGTTGGAGIGGGAAGSVGGGSAAGSNGAGSGGTTGAGGATAGGGTTGAGGATDGGGATGSAGGAGRDAGADRGSTDPGGCGCSTAPSRGGSLAALIGVALVAGRRRRPRRSIRQ